MKAKRHVVVLAVLAVLIPALWAVVRAADKTGGSVPQLKLTVEQRDTLRGLQGVGVVVEKTKPEVEQLGLTREALQTDTELQLRQYGIKVLSATETAVRGGPFLYVRVTAVGNGMAPFLAVSAQICLKQTAYLMRDPTIMCYATTWDVTSVFLVGRPRLPEIRERVKDHVAELINDYLSVNPKEAGAKEDAAESKP